MNEEIVVIMDKSGMLTVYRKKGLPVNVLVIDNCTQDEEEANEANDLGVVFAANLDSYELIA